MADLSSLIPNGSRLEESENNASQYALAAQTSANQSRGFRDQSEQIKNDTQALHDSVEQTAATIDNRRQEVQNLRNQTKDFRDSAEQLNSAAQQAAQRTQNDRTATEKALSDSQSIRQAVSADREFVATSKLTIQEVLNAAQQVQQGTEQTANSIAATEQLLTQLTIRSEQSAEAAQLSQESAADSAMSAGKSNEEAAASRVAAGNHETLARRWAVGNSNPGSPSNTNNARYWAQRAEEISESVLAGGGEFTPTADREYPDTSDIHRNTVWVYRLGGQNASYEYKTGSLKGTRVVQGWMLYYYKASDTFVHMPLSTLGLLAINGKSADDNGNITLLPEDLKGFASEDYVGKQLEPYALKDDPRFTDARDWTAAPALTGGDLTSLTDTTNYKWSNAAIVELTNSWWTQTGFRKKLNEIEEKAQVNDNLRIVGAARTSEYRVTLTGNRLGESQFNIPLVNDSRAGLMSLDQHKKLNDIQAGAQVNPDTTASRTSTSTSVLLQARAMRDHNQSGDHDHRYPLLETDSQTVMGHLILGRGSSTTAGRDEGQILSIQYPGDWETESDKDHVAIRIQCNRLNQNNGPYGAVGIRFATSTEPNRGPFIGALRRNNGLGDLIIKTGGSDPQERFRIADNGNITFTETLSGNGSGLTDLSAAQLTTGTIPAARINSTDSRTDASTTTFLQAKAMNDHRGSGDHDGRYARRGGEGASGTWGISISGSAATLTTPRQINGTNFDGSANIITSRWGTSRNITVGKTTKSVNGASNVSWSLAEIGAVDNTITINGKALTSNVTLGFADVGAVGASDARLTNARDWTASVVSESEARAGTSNTARKWTARRVREAIVAVTGSHIGENGGTIENGDLMFTTTMNGVYWNMNTDGAGIRFKNDGDDDPNSFLEFFTRDNNNEYFRWSHYTRGGATPSNIDDVVEYMTLRDSGLKLLVGSFQGNGSGLTNLTASNLSGVIPNANLPTTATRWPSYTEVTGTPNTTSSRTSSSTSTLLQARAMNDHRQSGDHDDRYIRRDANQTVAGEITFETFTEFRGKAAFGDLLDHPNIINALNQEQAVGTAAFRPINFIDTSGVIKVARVHEQWGPGVELYQWDEDLTEVITRADISAEDGIFKIRNIFNNQINFETQSDPSNLGELREVPLSLIGRDAFVLGDLTVTEGRFVGNGSGLTGDAPGLRARGTLKSDVGLSNVPNIDFRKEYNIGNGTNGDDWGVINSTRFVGGNDNTPDGTRDNFWGLNVTTGSGDRGFSMAARHAGGGRAKIYWSSLAGVWHEILHTGVSDPFDKSATYPNLRAGGTTKADVGLNRVDNFSRSDYDNRYAMMYGALGNTVAVDTLKSGFYTLNAGSPIYPFASSGGGLIAVRNDSGRVFGFYGSSGQGNSAKFGVVAHSTERGMESFELYHSGNSNPFNDSGNYASLRARGTTKADVGLSKVDNVSRAEYDARYVRSDDIDQEIQGKKTFNEGVAVGKPDNGFEIVFNTNNQSIDFNFME